MGVPHRAGHGDISPLGPPLLAPLRSRFARRFARHFARRPCPPPRPSLGSPLQSQPVGQRLKHNDKSTTALQA
eukprot:15460840-Alexandrium_andersonii.AAC.1